MLPCVKKYKSATQRKFRQRWIAGVKKNKISVCILQKVRSSVALWKAREVGTYKRNISTQPDK